MLFRQIGDKDSKVPLRALFDSGGRNTMINKRAVPKGPTVTTSAVSQPCTTVAGTFNANQTVNLRDGIFPEFDRHRRFDGVEATIFNSETCPYDIIIGRDLLHDLGFVLDFPNGHVRWMENFIFMKPRSHFHHHTNWTSVFDHGVLDVLDEPQDAFIMDAKYEATSAQEVADRQVHLDENQRRLLAQALCNTDELFDGQLGRNSIRRMLLYKTQTSLRRRQPRRHPGTCCPRRK